MSKYVSIIAWEDSPHLTPAVRESLIASIPESQRDARTKGIPRMGAGLLWPVPEEQIRIPAFAIPPHFRRCYGLDTGWSWNAAVWLAWDAQTDVVYLYDTFKRGACEPPIVASAIQTRGVWIPGVADAADVNRIDGRSYLEMYKSLGLDVELPDKSLESGIQAVWMRFATGKLKVFDTCTEFLEQYRVYSRNSHGVIPAEPRHDLCDALRYAVMSGLERARVKDRVVGRERVNIGHGEWAWMG